MIPYGEYKTKNNREGNYSDISKWSLIIVPSFDLIEEGKIYLKGIIPAKTIKKWGKQNAKDVIKIVKNYKDVKEDS